MLRWHQALLQVTLQNVNIFFPFWKVVWAALHSLQFFPRLIHWTNGSWALNCWLCSEPWCSLIVRHKESSLRRCISGPWLYGCLFCLFKRRSKSDKKLIFSLACTYPLYYVNIDSKRNSCSCNNPSDLMLPWYILTLGDCLLKTSYKSCCFPEMFLYSSNAICCTSSP